MLNLLIPPCWTVEKNGPANQADLKSEAVVIEEVKQSMKIESVFESVEIDEVT